MCRGPPLISIANINDASITRIVRTSIVLRDRIVNIMIITIIVIIIIILIIITIISISISITILNMSVIMNVIIAVIGVRSSSRSTSTTIRCVARRHTYVYLVNIGVTCIAMRPFLIVVVLLLLIIIIVMRRIIMFRLLHYHAITRSRLRTTSGAGEKMTSKPGEKMTSKPSSPRRSAAVAKRLRGAPLPNVSAHPIRDDSARRAMRPCATRLPRTESHLPRQLTPHQSLMHICGGNAHESVASICHLAVIHLRWLLNTHRIPLPEESRLPPVCIASMAVGRILELPGAPATAVPPRH